MSRDQKTFAAVVLVLLGGNANSILDRGEVKHMDCDRINALELEIFKLQLEVKRDRNHIKLAEKGT